MEEPEYYTVKNFKFRSGEVIPDLVMEYATFGREKTDESGYIINGILYLHGWAGNYRSVERIRDVLGPDKAINTREFFLICPTALGSPESSSPSTSKLGAEFPSYTIEDMVASQHLLLTQKFKINHLKGVIGTSMGGFQALTWAASYPDFMDFLLTIATSFEEKGRMFALYALMNILIEADPEYKQGNYLKQPKRALENAFMLSYLWSFSPEYYKRQYPQKEMLIQALADAGLESSTKDANDVVWRNRAALSYDMGIQLPRIKARALVLGIQEDQFFPPETDTIPLFKAINRAEIFIYNSVWGHMGIGHIKKAETVIKTFIDNL